MLIDMAVAGQRLVFDVVYTTYKVTALDLRVLKIFVPRFK